MGIQVIQGSSKTIIARLTSKSTQDPLDLTSYDELRFCFSSGSVEVIKKSLFTVGDTTISTPIVTNVPDTSDLDIGDPVSGAGIPSGAKVLTIDSPTQFTLDQDATATATAVPLTFGDITVVGNPLLGKVQIDLSALDTETLPEGSATIEAKVVIASATKYIQFTETVDVISKFC